MTDESWEILVHPDAIEKVRDLRQGGRPSLAERIVDKIEKLSRDPYRPRTGVDIRGLAGSDDPVYRLRVGSHRVIYEVAKDEHAVYVTQVVKRDAAYG